MAKISQLEDMVVYNESLELTKEIFDLCNQARLKREYSLCDQLKRASVSIVANIAEGFGRNTKADFKHFLSMSLGSANEVIALLDIVNLNFVPVNVVPLRNKYMVLCKRLYSFRSKLI